MKKNMQVLYSNLRGDTMSSLFQDDESKQWLTDAIREDIVEIQFEKKDGSVRAMKCTLKQDVIPADKTPKVTEEAKPVQTSALRVFDVEKQEWRSFRWDSVKSFKFGV